MKDGLRGRWEALRSGGTRSSGPDPADSDGPGPSGDRYVLVPGGPGRRRRLAEIGSVAGTAVVVLALVGATVATRQTSSDAPEDGPGLPAPSEYAGKTTAAPGTTAATGAPTGPRTTVYVSSVPTGRPLPTGTVVRSGTPTLPAPGTTRASAPRTTVPVPPPVVPTTTVPVPPPTTTTPPPPTTEPPPTTDPPTGP